MENEIKWAYVAHMYQFSDIEIRIGIGDRKFRGVSTYTSQLGTFKKAMIEDGSGYFVRTTQHEISEYKPILRHYDDMTEEEAWQLFKTTHVDAPWGNFGMAINHKTALDWYRNDYFSKKQSWVQWRVAEFLWLISHGFDVFSLIDSGQAIRKEAANG